MEQLQYNLLFRWFVGLGVDDPVWVPTVFTKNRDRLMTTDISRKVMAAILAHREIALPLSDEHFSVDGTLVTPPFSTGCIRRIHATIFSFWAGVMPPMPMLGRSLLYVQSHCVAKFWASSMLSMMYWSSHSCRTVRL